MCARVDATTFVDFDLFIVRSFVCFLLFLLLLLFLFLFLMCCVCCSFFVSPAFRLFLPGPFIRKRESFQRQPSRQSLIRGAQCQTNMPNGRKTVRRMKKEKEICCCCSFSLLLLTEKQHWRMPR